MKVCSTKSCKHSGVKQPLSNFYRNTAKRDGYNPHCKDCDNERSAAFKAKRNDNWIKMWIG